MANVAMVVTNACNPDPRVIKSAKWLVEQGHNVTIHAFDRQQSSPKNATIDGLNIVRYHLGLLPYGGLFRTGLGIRKFQNAVIKNLTSNSPSVVICHDADTLRVGCKVKKKLGSKVIFDMHDLQHTWVLMNNPNSLIRKGISKLMKRYMLTRLPQTDQILTSSGSLEGGKFPGFKQWLEQYGYDSVVVENRPQKSSLLTPPNSSSWTISHIGRIRDLASIRLLLEAIKSIPENQRPTLHIAGDGTAYNEVRQEITNFSRDFGLNYQLSESYGMDELGQVLENTNIMYAIYNPQRGNINDGALSVKMFDAASFGIPSVVNANCLMGEICEKESLGEAVTWNDVNQLTEALLKLKNHRVNLAMTDESFKEKYLAQFDSLLGNKRIV
ncbi:MAG: glycosyltransferase [Candidatus Thermoplasmatota archaeon]|nr:glycosyltransferase [Candidatus Thermoplasmatota archaeon]